MEKKRRDPRPLQMHLILRIAGGAYLAYIGASLRKAAFVGDKGLMYGLAMILFIIVGVILCIVSIKALSEGQYRLPFEPEYLDENEVEENGET